MSRAKFLLLVFALVCLDALPAATQVQSNEGRNDTKGQAKCEQQSRDLFKDVKESDVATKAGGVATTVFFAGEAESFEERVKLLTEAIKKVGVVTEEAAVRNAKALAPKVKGGRVTSLAGTLMVFFAVDLFTMKLQLPNYDGPVKTLATATVTKIECGLEGLVRTAVEHIPLEQ